jgi:periplasmic divalent cation tolerance protein
MTACLIYSTWPDDDRAAACGRALIENRLAACVTILPGARSTYRWDGKIQEDNEIVLLAKTDSPRAGAMRDAILAAHPYDVPCILSFAVDATHSNPQFLQWIAAETAGID